MLRRALTLLLLAGTGCGRGADPHATSDAGIDTAPTDAIADVRADVVTPDTALPSPLEDAHFEGGFGPFVGEWEGVPGVGCPILVAKKPSESVDALHWEPCPGGVAGCRIAVPHWAGPAGARLALDNHPVRRARGIPLLTTFRLWPTSPPTTRSEYSMTVAETLDGHTMFAAGQVTKNPCAGSAFNQVSDLGFVGAGLSSEKFPGYLLLLNVPFDTPGGPARAAFVPFKNLLPGGVVAVVQPDWGPKHAFYGVSGPSTISVIDPTSGDVANKVGGSGVTNAIDPIITKGGAYALNEIAGFRFYFVSDEATFEPVVELPSPRDVLNYAVDGLTGDLAWISGIFRDGPEGPGYYDLELWVTPYARNKAEAKPRLVVATPRQPQGGMVFDNGLVLSVFGNDGERARLTRISDGRGWTLTPLSGHKFFRPVWVDDNEVFLGDDDSSGGVPTGILRIRRDTLGAPDDGP